MTNNIDADQFTSASDSDWSDIPDPDTPTKQVYQEILRGRLAMLPQPVAIDHKAREDVCWCGKEHPKGGLRCAPRKRLATFAARKSTPCTGGVRRVRRPTNMFDFCRSWKKGSRVSDRLKKKEKVLYWGMQKEYKSVTKMM
jgi:hypothetical protein